MTRFEKIKTDLTVEEYADQNRFALKCNNCRKHQPGVFGACTFADCRKETIRYLNEEVENDSNIYSTSKTARQRASEDGKRALLHATDNTGL